MPGEPGEYRPPGNADRWGAWSGPVSEQPAVTPAARHTPGGGKRRDALNPSARLWRRTALIAGPLGFVLGCGVATAASAPERPTQRLTTVPAVTDTPGAGTGAQAATESVPSEVTQTAASVPVELDKPERRPLAGVGDDGAAAVREYYSNCRAARDAGVAPIFDDEPGYRSGLDRDHDGVACE